MKARIEKRGGIGSRIPFTELDDGDWFLDEDGDVGVKLSSGNAAMYFHDGDTNFTDYGDDFRVTPIQVTITY